MEKVNNLIEKWSKINNLIEKWIEDINIEKRNTNGS